MRALALLLSPLVALCMACALAGYAKSDMPTSAEADFAGRFYYHRLPPVYSASLSSWLSPAIGGYKLYYPEPHFSGWGNHHRGRMRLAQSIKTHAAQPTVAAHRAKRGPRINFFDLIGRLPDPVSSISQVPSLPAALAGGFVGSASWSLVWSAASTALRERREMSNGEACKVVLSSLPFIGMLPIWDKPCGKYPDTCYNPEYVSYAGLRDDDPQGRFLHWVVWMKKYCADVRWQKYAPRAQAYIDRTVSLK